MHFSSLQSVSSSSSVLDVLTDDDVFPSIEWSRTRKFWQRSHEECAEVSAAGLLPSETSGSLRRRHEEQDKRSISHSEEQFEEQVKEVPVTTFDLQT